MSKRVLIDLYKLRSLGDTKTDAFIKEQKYAPSFKTIRELATFQFTCRKCENAPCINACPANALEKDEQGTISRAVNLCIRCKSCIAICPFGTMMNDLFEVKTSGYNYFDLSDEADMKEFVKSFPKEVVSLVDMEANPEENIYELNEKVLIKEYPWE